MTESLAELYAQFRDPLMRMVYRRTGDRERAEDLVQEVFARAAAAPPRNPRPWLFAVALNLIREDGRRTSRRIRRLELYRVEVDQPEPTPDSAMERDERIVRVRSALDQLTERDRNALLLKAEGFNYEEIAETLGLAKGAVGTTLARARKRLIEAYRTEEGQRHAAS